MGFQRSQRRSFNRSVCQLEREGRRGTTMCLRQRRYTCGLWTGSVREHSQNCDFSHPYGYPLLLIIHTAYRNKSSMVLPYWWCTIKVLSITKTLERIVINTCSTALTNQAKCNSVFLLIFTFINVWIFNCSTISLCKFVLNFQSLMFHPLKSASSQDCRIDKGGRKLWTLPSPSPLLEQCLLELVVQSNVHIAFEYLQAQKLLFLYSTGCAPPNHLF